MRYMKSPDSEYWLNVLWSFSGVGNILCHGVNRFIMLFKLQINK